MDAIRETNLGTGALRRGKVRDCYEFDNYLLLVVSDRISAFDVVMPNGIPFKGKVLNQISSFWFDMTKDIIQNHVVTTDPAEMVKRLPELAGHEQILEGRSLLATKTEAIPVECVVRAYVAGSAWSEYTERGTVAEVEMPKGMLKSQKLDTPMFTPAIKAESGHDENISIGRMKNILGRGLSESIIETSFALFKKASEHAATRGMLIADTKFEFGLLDGHLMLIDEIFTPDSSRFWMIDEYEPGKDQKGFDKQPLRDWLQKLPDEGKWDKTPPAPELPDDVINYMSDLYRSAFKMITGGEVN